MSSSSVQLEPTGSSILWCNVSPFKFEAAFPVGAVTNIRPGYCFLKQLIINDFPDPA